MQEIRCVRCNKLLAKTRGATEYICIKCPRCKELTEYKSS
ncbi:MAG: Com family DNA-binding transcriptional regulator [Proteobacteria bacterium]|nr:Com family DNA-binding transcriptional regulator [Pseudomonadota bacterium]